MYVTISMILRPVELIGLDAALRKGSAQRESLAREVVLGQGRLPF